MKVFISWSGDLSKKVAEILKPWIKCVLQATDPFLSTEDIDKGSLWFNEINDSLANTGIGILCLTRENVSAPWVLFEAGSLAKGLSKNRVCTLLINLPPSELKPPLSQFNATSPNREDMFKLVTTINSTLKEKLADEILQRTFDTFWEGFEKELEKVLKNYKPSKQAHQRPSEDMLEEVLEISRSLQKSVQNQSEMLQRLEPNSSFPTPISAALLNSYLARQEADQKSQEPAFDAQTLARLFLEKRERRANVGTPPPPRPSAKTPNSKL